MVKVIVESVPICMDTGAAVPLLPYSAYKDKFSHIPLQKTSLASELIRVSACLQQEKCWLK